MRWHCNALQIVNMCTRAVIHSLIHQI